MEQGKEQAQTLQVAQSLLHFNWPTSKPGPRATQPPPGQKPMPGRTDQVVEIRYDQETGTPGSDSPLRSLPDVSLKGTTAFDQQEIAQDALKKRKKK
jgi:hypothetical protein